MVSPGLKNCSTVNVFPGRVTATTGHAVIEDDAVLPYSHCSGGSALISGEREEGCMAALNRMVF